MPYTPHPTPLTTHMHTLVTRECIHYTLMHNLDPPLHTVDSSMVCLFADCIRVWNVSLGVNCSVMPEELCDWWCVDYEYTYVLYNIVEWCVRPRPNKNKTAKEKRATSRFLRT